MLATTRERVMARWPKQKERRYDELRRHVHRLMVELGIPQKELVALTARDPQEPKGQPRISRFLSGKGGRNERMMSKVTAFVLGRLAREDRERRETLEKLIARFQEPG